MNEKPFKFRQPIPYIMAKPKPTPTPHLLGNVLIARTDAERKAWDSLGRYKFEMFGYWASAWVKFNQLLPKELKLPNPFKSLVHAARVHQEDNP